MSEDPNHSSKHRNILNSVLEELMDDTDDKIMMKIIEMKMKEEAESSHDPRRSRKYINRDREAGHERLFNDYFPNDPVYTDEMFRRRFRMNKRLFVRIVESLSNYSEYFQMRADATGRKGLSPLQKCTAAIRQLAYGTADLSNKYVRIGESTAIECLMKFCRCVIEIFGPVYLRRPNDDDVQRLLQQHSNIHGFPGMLGSIDCMHWPWNCAVAWKGHLTRRDQGIPTIMLEAVASYDLWIWHAFFGVTGSNNNINVLNQSPLFNDVLHGYSPDVQFTINGTQYTKAYYLADGIYPEWASFVKSFSYPEDLKRKLFKDMQEAARKDVERAFGVLHARWAIIRGAARFWHMKDLRDIMSACIILHNMIVEDEVNSITNWCNEEAAMPEPVSQGPTQEFQQYLQRYAELRDRQVHHKFRADLVEHIWERFGQTNNED